ncbi:MAG: hypothetical protein H7330_02805 [Hymenobacteraceae bacterium]|nr:hypothetical protein [Hymenobacteraceae bacterium]
MLATLAGHRIADEQTTPNVAVFKTNVASARQALIVVSLIQAHVAGCRVTLDLDDCDRMLRVQDCYHDAPLPEAAIRRLMSALGFAIEALTD